MNQSIISDYLEAERETSGLVRSVAEQALAQVVSKHRAIPAEDYSATIKKLSVAVLSDDPDARSSTIADLIAHGVSTYDIVNHYAPDTARGLGEAWHRNEISFVDVTIGVARLQESIRVLSSRRVRNENTPNRPRVLIIVPEQEDHVFGGLTATLIIEKHGCDVTFAVGQGLKELTASYSGAHFDMVGLSFAASRNIRHTREIISTLRKSASTRIPFVVGSSLLDTQDLDLKDLTGADLVTTDAKEALKFCNIEVSEASVACEET